MKIGSLTGIPIAYITCGASHSFAISKWVLEKHLRRSVSNVFLHRSGEVFGFGKNRFGQLGIGHTEDSLYPAQLKTLRSIGVRYISAGDNFSVFLTQDGSVLTCGNGRYGQLGHGDRSNGLIPRKIVEMMGIMCTQVVCGSHHTLIYVPFRGHVYGFGRFGSSSGRSSGELGTQSTSIINVLSPRIINGPWATLSRKTISDKNALFISQIFSGRNLSFAMTANNFADHKDNPIYK